MRVKMADEFVVEELEIPEAGGSGVVVESVERIQVQHEMTVTERYVIPETAVSPCVGCYMTRVTVAGMSDEDAIKLAMEHGMLLQKRKCTNCRRVATYNNKLGASRCQKSKGGRSCNFYWSFKKKMQTF